MKIIESPSGGHMIVDGNEIINFGGTCYLGITKIPDLIDSAKSEIDRIGAMGQIPRHYGYITQCMIDVENSAKEFFQTEAATYFSSGYLFASMALQGLKDDFDVLFIDEKSHYSIRDGVMTTGKTFFEFKYSDPEDLKRVLQLNLRENQIPCVVVDGMFPTYGNISPLERYYDIIKRYGGWLVVDESHSFGIIGATGNGAVEHFNLSREKIVAGGSMAKAFCAYGGLAVGSQYAIDKIKNSPPAKGAASGMSAAAAMTNASLKYVRAHPELLLKARERILYLKTELNRLGYDIEMNLSPVATFELENAETMKKLQKYLEDNGVFVQYSTYVGAGPEGVIRLASYPDHTDEDIKKLTDLLVAFKRNYNGC